MRCYSLRLALEKNCGQTFGCAVSPKEGLLVRHVRLSLCVGWRVFHMGQLGAT